MRYNAACSETLIAIFPLTEEVDIEKAYREVCQAATAGEELYRPLNFFRSDGPTEIYWHSKERVWFHLGYYEEGVERWAIVCGDDDPHVHLNELEIICTFNVPKRGFNRRCAGVFLQDHDHNVYLGHNGSFPKFHRSVAQEELSGWKPVTWPDDKTSSIIVIAELFTNEFVSSVSKFVHQAKTYKATNR